MGAMVKGKEARKGKESESQCAIYSLGEDIHALSIRHSFASSPSGPFLCRGAQFPQSMVSRRAASAPPGNLLAMQQFSGPTPDTRNQKSWRGDLAI